MNVYDAQLVNDGRILHHLGLMLVKDSHGVKSPESTVHSPQVRCAWCERERERERPEDGGSRMEDGSRVSHGICDRHAAAVRAEIEQMHKEAA